MPREIFDAIRTERLVGLRSAMAGILPRSDAQIVLEIGCGNGHFLTAYAAAHPNRLCVGIDLRLERITKALRKRDRTGLSNLHFLRCEARDFLHELPAGVRLLDIYMLFPDPWPKKRHHKNRLFQAGFLDELGARAEQGSRLFFRTDYKPYYDEALEIVAAHPRWRPQPAAPFPFEHLTIFQARAPTFHSLGAEWAAARQAVQNRFV
jgi:tRNA (guanine-N7-)-methyltransferase